MTIPFFIEDPTQYHRPEVRVPYDIVQYCEDYTLAEDRTDIRFVDCVWMHMGYYGTPPDIMKAIREEYFNAPPVRPVFE